MIHIKIIFQILFVQNSGVAHGRIVRRSRILKNVEKNEYYSWKDLNIGIDLNLFGIKYHLLDCDPFTRVRANAFKIKHKLNRVFFDFQLGISEGEWHRN